MREIRQSRKQSQRAFGRESGLTAQRVARVEDGTATLYLSDLFRLAPVLSMRPWQLARHMELSEQ